MERHAELMWNSILVLGLAACLVIAGIHYLITRRRK